MTIERNVKPDIRPEELRM